MVIIMIQFGRQNILFELISKDNKITQTNTVNRGKDFLIFNQFPYSNISEYFDLVGLNINI